MRSDTRQAQPDAVARWENEGGAAGDGRDPALAFVRPSKTEHLRLPDPSTIGVLTRAAVLSGDGPGRTRPQVRMFWPTYPRRRMMKAQGTR